MAAPGARWPAGGEDRPVGTAGRDGLRSRRRLRPFRGGRPTLGGALLVLVLVLGAGGLGRVTAPARHEPRPGRPGGGAPTAGPAPGQALVGLFLAPGQLPVGALGTDDRVELVVVASGANGSPRAPATVVAASVWSVHPPAQGKTGITVVVPASLGPYLASAASEGDLAVVRLANAR